MIIMIIINKGLFSSDLLKVLIVILINQFVLGFILI